MAACLLSEMPNPDSANSGERRMLRTPLKRCMELQSAPGQLAKPICRIRGLITRLFSLLAGIYEILYKGIIVYISTYKLTFIEKVKVI